MEAADADVRRPWDELLSAGIGGLLDGEAVASELTAQGVPDVLARQLVGMLDGLLQVGMSDDLLESVVQDLSPAQRTEVEPFLREQWQEHPLFELVRAVYALRSGDGAGAFARMDHLGEQHAHEPGMLLLVAQFAMMAGLVDTADRIVLRAFETHGPSPDLDLVRAHVALLARRPQRAIALLEPLVSLRPTHVDALYLLAAAHELMGNDDVAFRYCEAVLAIEPRHVDATYTAAALAARLGRTRSATQYERRTNTLGRPLHDDGRRLLLMTAPAPRDTRASRGACWHGRVAVCSRPGRSTRRRRKAR